MTVNYVTDIYVGKIGYLPDFNRAAIVKPKNVDSGTIQSRCNAFIVCSIKDSNQSISKEWFGL